MKKLSLRFIIGLMLFTGVWLGSDLPNHKHHFDLDNPWADELPDQH
ncbi:hypothetical protein [Pontibacillus yanchengensis]|nr:hypothetical protein [Pontibacillus yanchengensis]